jgi:hypothetical protein
LKKLFWIFALLVCTTSAHALELDWGGEFRSEFNLIKNYTMDSSTAGSNFDPGRAAGHGYYVAPAGSSTAEFQTLFMKLTPKAVVNDNIYIKSEFWLGDPTYGFYGGGTPYSLDQKYYNSTYSRGSVVSAQRYWAEFLSDFGTLQVGRVPLQYGLGVNWNAGDGLWDHYESTGDAVRLIAKFGAFSFIPAAISYSTGNTIGGACQQNADGTCSALPGGGAVNDYSLQVKYENPDEDFEAAINFIRRITGGGQDPNSGQRGVDSATTGNPATTNAQGQGTPATYGPSLSDILAGGAAYNTWDIYAKKKIGKLALGVEVPIVSGNVAGIPYSTWALAAETDYKASDTWEFESHFGRAPGQPDDSGPTPSNLKGYYFHPNYQVGLIMFNYQLANFHGPNTLNGVGQGGTAAQVTAADLLSPYDNPITNADYLNVGTLLHAEKWTFDLNFLIARANEVCQASQSWCFNSWEHRLVTQNQGDQSRSLGWELDTGASFQYDENFNFRLDTGLFFPGQYYAYANTPPGATQDGTTYNNGTTASPTTNQTSVIWAVVGKVGVQF